jgi:phenylalanyl-tRNA synthetase beta chain
VAPPFSGVVVAEILRRRASIRKPTACASAGRRRKGVGTSRCRSSAVRRMRAGIRVPLAMVGAELPPGEDGKPFRIGVGKLRGVQSQTACCARPVN